METLVLVLKLAVVGAALYFWALTMQLILSLPRHKKPEVPWSEIPGAGINPYNIILRPRHLTEQGQNNLFWAVVYAGVFTAIAVAAKTSGWAAEALSAP